MRRPIRLQERLLPWSEMASALRPPLQLTRLVEIGLLGGATSSAREYLMPDAYSPHGVIPAVLLPFDNELSIDEASFRKHVRDVIAAPGISAITVNAHSTEVASCTFDEQRRVLDVARDEIGERIGIVNGIWA